MKLRTEIPITPPSFQLNYKDEVLALGSCFTQNIGDRLTDYGFHFQSNPYGITYNPLSIIHSLQEILEEKKYEENDLVFHKEQWHSLNHHSCFSNSDSNVVLEEINEAISKAKSSLDTCDVLILSFGSAWIYEKDSVLVNNCHQIPNNEFSKRIIGAKEITKTLLELKSKLNPKTRIILTISPIRHLKDGALENSRSKSTLIYAAQYLANNADGFYYFPSYELMIDDLRDYRFYESDLLHPNELAKDYIWSKFSAAFMSTETLAIIEEVKKLRKAEKHRLFNPESSAAIKHKEYILSLTEKIKTNHPEVKLQAAVK